MPCKRDHRLRSAFTLIELLVVISIVGLLIGILLPALGQARRSGQAAVSLVNLKQMGIVHLSYSHDNKDCFCNPFDLMMAYPTAAGGFNRGFWSGVFIPSHGQDPGWMWRFNDKDFASLMFSPHWASLMLAYIDNGNYATGAQFAPQDRAVIQRFKKLQADLLANAPSVRGNTIDTVFWDGSYWMSPTLWLRSTYFTANSAHVPIQSTLAFGQNYWKRNRIDQVPMPQAKVMVWERFDFLQPTRKGLGGGRESLFPNWNNDDASPRFVTVDGSAGTVKVSKLKSLIAHDEADGSISDLRPTEYWDVPDSILGNPDAPLNQSGYGMAKDGLENGDAGKNKYPAYFWSTRNGINGRDVNR